MDNDSSEIAKLTERIAKDPKSKLFVPLAEEYKKAGDIEMSIHVLTEGLKHNPGYITAKSFLGRLLLEKGDLAAAKKEFEDVVKTIPDNLMAQRKLGDIYALEGNREKALEHYKVAQSLNPRDEEVRSLISDIEAGRSVNDRIITQTPASGRKSPISVPKTEPPLSKPEASINRPRPATLVATHTMPVEEEAEEVLIVEPLEEDVGLPLSAPLDFLAETQAGPAFEETVAEPAVLFTAPALDVEKMQSLHEEPLAAGLPRLEDREASKKADDLTTNTLAELYISQGFYEKAIDIYERMLAEDPGNKALMDKLVQVRAMANQGVLEKASTTPAPGPSLEDMAAWIPPSEEPEPFHGIGADFPSAAGVVEEFEPRPYGHPKVDAAPEMSEGQPGMDKKKKETIDRLEQWLRNIMKEKQR